MPAALARHCAVCGRSLPPDTRKDARFCSAACRQAAYKRRQPPVVRPTESALLIDRITALRPFERRALVFALREQLTEEDTGQPSITMLERADYMPWDKSGDTYTGPGGVTITRTGRRYRLDGTGQVFPSLSLAKRAGGLWAQGWNGSVPTHSTGGYYL
jgi:predicted nucleic acid-binding Zn ribbon protein